MKASGTTRGEANRRLPALDSVNEFFWTAGASGRLQILRCDSCGHWLHPPAPICPDCLSRSLTPQTLSGLGKIEAVTIHHQSSRTASTAPCRMAWRPANTAASAASAVNPPANSNNEPHGTCKSMLQ